MFYAENIVIVRFTGCTFLVLFVVFLAFVLFSDLASSTRYLPLLSLGSSTSYCASATKMLSTKGMRVSKRHAF